MRVPVRVLKGFLMGLGFRGLGLQGSLQVHYVLLFPGVGENPEHCWQRRGLRGTSPRWSGGKPWQRRLGAHGRGGTATGVAGRHPPHHNQAHHQVLVWEAFPLAPPPHHWPHQWRVLGTPLPPLPLAVYSEYITFLVSCQADLGNGIGRQKATKGAEESRKLKLKLWCLSRINLNTTLPENQIPAKR